MKITIYGWSTSGPYGRSSQAALGRCRPRLPCRRGDHLSDDDITGIGINLVAHYKLHIIPRFRHDKVRIEWDRWPAVDDEARVAYAQTVRDSLNGGKAG